MFDIEEELKKLPDKPGVYLMHDENDTIIYVGKAKNLYNRVNSYFVGKQNNKTAKLVSQIEDIQYIIDNKSDISLKSFIPENFDLANNTHYVFEINNNISKMHNGSEMFKSLNEYLKENQVSIKEIMNDEFQRKIDCNLIMSNIFTDLKEFFEISVEKKKKKVSETEKLLLTDNVYKKMTIESKLSYRKQLLKLAKKNHMSEYEYLNKIMDKNEHIGYKLFKDKDTNPKVILYISVIL